MDANDHKRSIAQNLLLQKPLINAQILTEVANVCKRRFKYDKDQVVQLWIDLLTDCIFVETTKSTFFNSIELVKKYNFQIFDSLIVSSALNSNCTILYSEDMQHGMKVDNRLSIINPFI
ncbi:MAG: PilT protein-like protein [Mucilaginibacter sp.]|nr:PilT protein-like protein [Mucilaginibacter sp.]